MVIANLAFKAAPVGLLLRLVTLEVPLGRPAELVERRAHQVLVVGLLGVVALAAHLDLGFEVSLQSAPLYFFGSGLGL